MEEYVCTRNGAQIRSHAQKYFNKLNKSVNGPKPAPSHNHKSEGGDAAEAHEKSVLAAAVPTPFPVVPKVIVPPSDPATFAELSRHIEVVDSLIRVLQSLQPAPENDPLAELKLTQGEILLDKISDMVQQIAAKAHAALDLQKLFAELIAKIKTAYGLINDVSPVLDQEKYCKYLASFLYDFLLRWCMKQEQTKTQTGVKNMGLGDCIKSLPH